MNKKQIFYVLLVTIAFTFLLNLFFGRFVAARLSTIPLLNRFNILSPQAPIVINTREEVRVNDGKDILEAVANIKSRLSQVVLVQNGQFTVAGYAVNVASEGLFCAPQSIFSSKTGNYFLVLPDGRQAPVGSKVVDPATGVVFFSADLNAVPVATWGDSSQLKPGEKIIAVRNSLQAASPLVEVLFVGRAQDDVFGQTYDADRPSRVFGTDDLQGLPLGTALVNTQGEVVGMLSDKGAVVSSDVLKKITDLYFQNRQKITRPYFGFTYSQLTRSGSQLRGLPEGVQVLTVDRTGKTKSPAADAGLLEKDVIVSVDGQALSENQLLEEMLQKYKPGDIVKFQIQRGKDLKELSLQVKELSK
ncbi:MAG: S1C family serine protease [Patescibacteria group bacterium]|nr:S1C family serine protease [Patescibacteria group bacterium]